MPKFDFTEKDLAQWRDEPYILEGTNHIGMVLIHGWTAIPKQVKHIAELLNQQGYWVSVPRLTGHGTYPEDLENATAEDWIKDGIAAVEELKRKNNFKHIIIGGVSLGGNISILTSLHVKVDGLILIGTPAYLKNHFFIWWSAYFGAIFKKYYRKNYPKGVDVDVMEATSYQYFPFSSVQESFNIMRKSLRALKRTKIPTLIFQISGDYMIGKRSPWMIYKNLRSQYKKINWISSAKKSHIPLEGELDDFIIAVSLFISDLQDGV